MSDNNERRELAVCVEGLRITIHIEPDVNANQNEKESIAFVSPLSDEFFGDDSSASNRAESNTGTENHASKNGVIIARIESVVQSTSKKGNEQLVWKYAYRGQNGGIETANQYTVIGGKDNNGYLLSNMEKLGFANIEVSNINSGFLQKLSGREVEIAVSMKDGYTTAQMVRAL